MDKNPTKKTGKEYDESEFTKCDLKLLILGDSAIGKSKLVERFLLDDYESRQLSTYALTMYRYNANIEGKVYKVGNKLKKYLNLLSFIQKDIWDTAGQSCFDQLHPSYYYGANACILGFDITRKITYTNLKSWYNEMKEHCPHIPCIIMANKIDMDRSVTETKFKFAEQNNIPLYYVSAADGTNVVKVFNEALKLALENKLHPPDSFMNDVMEFLNEKD